MARQPTANCQRSRVAKLMAMGARPAPPVATHRTDRHLDFRITLRIHNRRLLRRPMRASVRLVHARSWTKGTNSPSKVAMVQVMASRSSDILRTLILRWHYKKFVPMVKGTCVESLLTSFVDCRLFCTCEYFCSRMGAACAPRPSHCLLSRRVAGFGRG